jgi:methyl-accepting chemotaxis protein
MTTPTAATELAEQQKMMAQLRELIGREVGGARNEIARTCELVREAVRKLGTSFADMEAQSRRQSAAVGALVEKMSRELAAGAPAPGASALLPQVAAVDQALAEGMKLVGECGEQIQASVATAVRSLQFEDIATQALTAANGHLERLQAINRDATALHDDLARAAEDPGALQHALEDFTRRLREQRDSWVKPLHKPVSQVSLDSGTVELF